MENQKEYSNIQLEINKIKIEKNKIKEENKEIFDKLEQLDNEEKLLIERQDILKDTILTEYDTNKLDQDFIYDDDILTIKYSPSYFRTGVDNKKLQKEYEEAYLNCLKKTTVKSSLKVNIK